jgi:sigma-70-like protein
MIKLRQKRKSFWRSTLAKETLSNRTLGSRERAILANCAGPSFSTKAIKDAQGRLQHPFCIIRDSDAPQRLSMGGWSRTRPYAGCSPSCPTTGLSPREKCERSGSFCVHVPIPDRTDSLQWPWFAEKSGDAKNGTAPSDAELAERLKRRDENAFLILYDLHRSTIFRFLMYMTGSAAAEELAQEVFVAILDAMCAGTLSQFDPEKGTWEGYLLGIARNLARANRRRENRVVSLDSVLNTPE